MGQWPQSTIVTTTGTIGARGDLGAAAAIIADRAKELSAVWSVRVPRSISLSVHGNIADIVASAPPARPNELALRHPLFGNRAHWYGPNYRPFLRPAAYGGADAALKRYAQKIDQWAHDAGVRVKISYGGKVYDLDLANFTLKQAMAIQGYTGSSVMGLFQQFKNIEEDTPELLKAIGAIYWLMCNQAGEVFPIADSDPPLVPFLEAFIPALLADTGAAEAEPDPTFQPSQPGGAVSVSPAAPPSLSVPREVSASPTVS